MKLIELLSSPVDDLYPEMILMTDSSISSQGKPVFVPELSNEWVCRFAPVFRIGRLGKTISRRFASRYVDAVAMSARLVPLEMEATTLRLSPWATAFDGAISIGRFVNPETANRFEVSVENRKLDGKVADRDIDRAIELISRYFILKNGDLIIPYGPRVELPVSIDNKVEASLDGTLNLKFNVK